jgi:hypothetical protein
MSNVTKETKEMSHDKIHPMNIPIAKKTFMTCYKRKMDYFK